MTRLGWAFDAALAVAVAASGAAEAVWGINATHQQGPVAAQTALYVITGLLLVVRRVAPMGCLAAIVAVSLAEFAMVGSPEGLGIALPAAIGAYSVARYTHRRRSWWGLVLIGALWLAWDLFDPLITAPILHVEQLGWAFPWIVAWLVGALVRSQVQHAAQRRAARGEIRARAIAEERNRIARELHDVLGHSVSVMTVQASAVRRRLTPDQVEERQALESVETVGREAMVEMRRMIGMLRQGDEEQGRHPSPGLAQADALVGKFVAAGPAVVYRVVGTERALPTGIDLTCYRVIQEGLTNALRHAASPRSVQVTVTYAEHDIEVCVRDDGRAVNHAVEPGHGLLGMRERVTLYGGTLLARAADGGGFELIARLPTALDPQEGALA